MFEDKFREWLRKQVANHGGDQSATAIDLGTDQPWISKVLSAKADVTIGRLQEIASALPKPLADLIREIDDEVDPKPNAEVRSIDENLRRAWVVLFRNEPRRGMRVLANMRHQEQLGYTDLISEIAATIIERGPALAIPKVSTALAQAAEHEQKGGRRESLRKRLAQEYKQIK